MGKLIIHHIIGGAAWIPFILYALYFCDLDFLEIVAGMFTLLPLLVWTRYGK